MYREILTKAIIAKGQRKIKEKREVNINKQISKILGCWIINHKSKTNVIKQNIIIEGTYDAYFWYGYEFDSKCDLHYEQFSLFPLHQENILYVAQSNASSLESNLVLS